MNSDNTKEAKAGTLREEAERLQRRTEQAYNNGGRRDRSTLTLAEDLHLLARDLCDAATPQQAKGEQPSVEGLMRMVSDLAPLNSANAYKHDAIREAASRLAGQGEQPAADECPRRQTCRNERNCTWPWCDEQESSAPAPAGDAPKADKTLVNLAIIAAHDLAGWGKSHNDAASKNTAERLLAAALAAVPGDAPKGEGAKPENET